MKKLISIITSIALCLSVSVTALADEVQEDVIETKETVEATETAEAISIYVDNTKVAFEDAAPIIKSVDGGTRTLVPLRKVGTMLGASVYWFDEDKTIQVVTEDRMLMFQIDKALVALYKIENGSAQFKKDITLDESAQLISDRTYVPLRAASDLLLADWEDVLLDVSGNVKIASVGDFKYGENSNVNGNSDLGLVYMPMREYRGEGNGITTRTGVLVNDDLGEYYLETDDNSLYKLNISEAELINQIGDSDFNIEKDYKLRVSGLWDATEITLKRSTTSIVCVPTTVTFPTDVKVAVKTIGSDLAEKTVTDVTSVAVLPGTILNLQVDKKYDIRIGDTTLEGGVIEGEFKNYAYTVPYNDVTLTTAPSAKIEIESIDNINFLKIGDTDFIKTETGDNGETSKTNSLSEGDIYEGVELDIITNHTPQHFGVIVNGNLVSTQLMIDKGIHSYTVAAGENKLSVKPVYKVSFGDNADTIESVSYEINGSKTDVVDKEVIAKGLYLPTGTKIEVKQTGSESCTCTVADKDIAFVKVSFDNTNEIFTSVYVDETHITDYTKSVLRPTGTKISLSVKPDAKLVASVGELKFIHSEPKFTSYEYVITESTDIVFSNQTEAPTEEVPEEVTEENTEATETTAE